MPSVGIEFELTTLGYKVQHLTTAAFRISDIEQDNQTPSRYDAPLTSWRISIHQNARLTSLRTLMKYMVLSRNGTNPLIIESSQIRNILEEDQP